jgi:hypothetical protein
MYKVFRLLKLTTREPVATTATSRLITRKPADHAQDHPVSPSTSVYVLVNSRMTENGVLREASLVCNHCMRQD